jgi:hypothetical protein
MKQTYRGPKHGGNKNKEEGKQEEQKQEEEKPEEHNPTPAETATEITLPDEPNTSSGE